jgi:hypothetical protein
VAEPLACSNFNSQRGQTGSGIVQPFFTVPSKKNGASLFTDADPDIPILKQAKAEYAKLQ